ncbi:uncharacterized protein SCHCODRAFT_01087873 [Schizophyllum commune H4-8]|nr:uncharacterized protein SCHCODRAFT_01087873 [Schizophyllum commune H4-8]KAI5895243.1 hypothetical protein SCHCODRAFT_01087873 [Schizophyllum commune H4-8]
MRRLFCALLTPSHNQCSEGFYKKQVASDIQGQPSASAEERRRMMEVLKRFEEAASDGLGEDLDDEDEDGSEAGDELAARLEGVDLDSIPPDELWELLTPEQRAKFMEAVNNPESELARSLLVSEQVAIRPPWWEADASRNEGKARPNSGEGPASIEGGRSSRPSSMRIPARMVKPLPVGQVSLVYNFVAICIAYAYTVRHLALSRLGDAGGEDADEARRIVRALVPFLSDKRSRTVFSGLEEAVTDVWSRMDGKTRSAPLFAALLKDTAALLRPSLVVASTSLHEGDFAVEESTDSSTLPQATSILVLSDLLQLFEDAAKSTPSTPIGHKLLFYAAHLASTPTQVLQLVAGEARARAAAFEREAQEIDGSANFGTTMKPAISTQRTPVIEELS